MSTSYNGLSRTHNILHSMLNVASTESFEVVRQQFFSSYLVQKASIGASKDKEGHPQNEVDPLLEAARAFAANLPKVCKKYASNNLHDQKNLSTTIEAILQKPGTPYERVGNVLAWFKEWRSEQRQLAGAHPNHGYDTRHIKLQESMTALLLDVAHALIAKEPPAPAHAIDILRGHPKKTVCDDPTPPLSRPYKTCNYTPFGGPLRSVREERRDDWLQESNKNKGLLEKASAWQIVLDWSWKPYLCFRNGSTVKSREVPPLYTLGRYLLVADKDTWSREHVCDALIMEKTFQPTGEENRQSGLDIGLAPRSTMDVQKHDAWWKEQERQSAKDWRYIRRNSVLLVQGSESLKDITVGDAVARLKKFGPREVVNGAFAYESIEIKKLLLERIQPELGNEFITLKQVEDSMGSMPEVIIDALNTKLASGKTAQPEPKIELGQFFD